jgi:hypothetical protein
MEYDHIHFENTPVEPPYHTHKSHEASLYDELACHFPFAAFSVAFGFIILSFLYFIGLGFGPHVSICRGYHILFHSFHYLHIVYAVMGTMVTFSRFSNNIIRGTILSIVSPAFFCTLSDVILPALAGRILGVPMGVHICFFSIPDLLNVIPLMIVGLVTGIVIRSHKESSLGLFSLGSHFVHILISSLASLLYMVSYGFDTWYSSMGLLYLLLVIAVVVPCTVSDVVVPIYFARLKRMK